MLSKPISGVRRIYSVADTQVLSIPKPPERPKGKWIKEINSLNAEDGNVLTLDSKNAFASHGFIQLIADAATTNKREDCESKPFPLDAPIGDSIKRLLIQGLPVIRCDATSDLFNYVTEMKGRPRSEFYDLMAPCLDGNFHHVLGTDGKPDWLVFNPQHLEHQNDFMKAEGVYESGGLLAMRKELIGTIHQEKLEGLGRSMLDVTRLSYDGNDQKALESLNLVFATHGLRDLKLKRTQRTPFSSPLELMGCGYWFNESTIAARSKGDSKNSVDHSFKINPSFTKIIDKDLIFDFGHYEAFGKSDTPITASVKEVVLSQIGKGAIRENKTDYVDEFKRNKASKIGATAFFNQIWNMEPCYIPDDPLCDTIKMNQRPFLGFAELQQLISNAVCTCIPKESRNRLKGRLLHYRWITSNLLLFAAVDSRVNYNDTVIRYFVFWRDGDVMRQLMFRRENIIKAEENRKLWIQMIQHSITLNPYSLPFLFVALQSLQPSAFSYDLGTIAHMIKSDDRSGTGTGDLKEELLSLAREKMEGRGPKNMRDVVMCDIMLTCMKHSSPACMFMGKFLSALSRTGRAGLMKCSQKSSKSHHQYGETIFPAKPSEKKRLLKWLRVNLQQLCNKEEVGKYIKKNPPTISDAITMNAAMGLTEDGHLKSTPCGNALFSFLCNLVEEHHVAVNSLNALEDLLNSILDSIVLMFDLFPKIQPNAQRPIAKYNASGRLVLAYIRQISTAIGQGQNVDCVTKPTSKEALVAKHLEFRNKRKEEGCLSGSLFLDVTNFCGTMDYDLCTDIMTILSDYCFPGGPDLVSARTLLFNHACKVAKRRIWQIPMRTAACLCFADLANKETHELPLSYCRQILDFMDECPDSFDDIVGPVATITLESSEGEIVIDGAHHPHASDVDWSDCIVKVVIKDRIKSVKSVDINGNVVEEEKEFNEESYFGVLKCHGSEEGQVMEMESVAFAYILQYVMYSLGFTTRDFVVNCTSDDVLISYSSPIIASNVDTQISTQQEITFGIKIEKAICNKLAELGVYLSKHKLSLNVDRPDESSYHGELFFNSSLYRNDPTASTYGEKCHHIARELRNIMSIQNSVNYKHALEAERSGFIEILRSFPFLDDQYIRQMSLAYKVAADFNWGSILYELDGIPWNSMFRNGSLVYRGKSDVFQHPLLLELELNESSWPMFTCTEGEIAISQHTIMDRKVNDHFVYVKDNINRLFASGKYNLACDLMTAIYQRVKPSPMQPDFFCNCLPYRFGRYFDAYYNVLEAYSKPVFSCKFPILLRLVYDGKVTLNSSSSLYVPVYSGSVLSKDQGTCAGYLKTIMALTENTDLSSIGLESWMNLFDSTISEEAKVYPVFINPTPYLAPLSALIEDDAFKLDLISVIKAGKLPAPVHGITTDGITVIYSQMYNGDVIIARDGVGILVIDRNGEGRPIDNRDFMLNSSWLWDYEVSHMANYSILGLCLNSMGETASHLNYSSKKGESQLIYRKESVSVNLVKLIGFGIVSRLSIAPLSRASIDADYLRSIEDQTVRVIKVNAQQVGAVAVKRTLDIPIKSFIDDLSNLPNCEVEVIAGLDRKSSIEELQAESEGGMAFSLVRLIDQFVLVNESFTIKIKKRRPDYKLTISANDDGMPIWDFATNVSPDYKEYNELLTKMVKLIEHAPVKQLPKGPLRNFSKVHK